MLNKCHIYSEKSPTVNLPISVPGHLVLDTCEPLHEVHHVLDLYTRGIYSTGIQVCFALLLF